MQEEVEFQIQVPSVLPENGALLVLWLGYLVISPSYRLAHLDRTVGLSDDQRQMLPEDFERVLKFYDDFGEVEGVEFEDWWVDRGSRLCADIGELPRVMEIASLDYGVINHSTAGDGIEKFLNHRWITQGMQNSVLVSIPLGMPKAKINRQIANILEAQPEDKKVLSKYEPKYRLAGKRNNGETLLRYMNTLIIKSAIPDAELWRTGAAAGISETYSPELEADQAIKEGEATYDRMMLTILTSRALRRARMLAENAARGVFPSHKTCEHALEIDLAEVYRIHFADYE